jgi:zinc-ribbon domain
MNCPVCGAQNLPNAAFCSQCATSLMVPPHLAGAPHMMPRTSGMAIAGFVLSFLCGLLGLIFSIIGYNECKKSGGAITGEGLAIAGIIISIVNMLIGIAISAGGN